jgi:hypothetical protein
LKCTSIFGWFRYVLFLVQLTLECAWPSTDILFCHAQAYESLWDDLTKIFLKNSSPDVLGPTITALTHLLSTEALSNANTRKIAELDEALLASLRSAVSERDVETAAFEEEDIDSLTGNCMRIGLLFSWRNLCEAMDETDGGKQMSGWAIMLALAARGSVGYREEGKVRIVARYLIREKFRLTTSHFRSRWSTTLSRLSVDISSTEL